MTRARFYPCQTEDGRTYVMRSGGGISPPVIVSEIPWNFLGTTERWAAAKRRANRLNAEAAIVAAKNRRTRLVALAFLVAAVIVAAFTWGL